MDNKQDQTYGSLEPRYNLRQSTVAAAAEHQRAHPKAHKEALNAPQSQIHAQSQATPHGHKTKGHTSEKQKNHPHNSNNKAKPEHAAVHLATGNEETLEHPMHPEHHEQSS
ncbi:hypothetical protein CPC16_005600 [Podila verticillata]|nr:hypothetical protein BGZ52_008291 [Haplosporangium bisporale]KAF9213007.1 hypothetical protein BGZ59_006027 [Podila verticillata]KAF9389732.1 hypothetical protein CPC16_005600 [Podila verticillata]KFH64928.1 hypothetical protein MVEG_09656 [Podila verticillata NRRL 6337]